MKKYYTATEAKNKFGSVLNDVVKNGYTAIIQKNNKPIVEIKSIKQKNVSDEEKLKALRKLYGCMPDFPDVTKDRVSRKREIEI